MQKAQRFAASLAVECGFHLNRVTAVVIDDMAESFVAAVTRMVLVGRGGVRLHEEVFLVGVRLRGAAVRWPRRRPNTPSIMPWTGASTLASRPVRDELCEIWNAADAPRARLEESMHARADRRHAQVLEQLDKRRAADIQRARDIFSAFRTNLRESLNLLRSKEAEAEAMLWADEQKQWRRDIDSMERRLDELDDEEAREIAAIADRYADVKPTTAAAVVFALLLRTRKEGFADGARTPRQRSAPSASELHRAWLELVD